MGDITWTNDTRKLSQLIPWPRNPRLIKGEQVARLQASFEQFGQPEVIAIGPGNEVYNGHQRLKSWAARFGDIEVAVRVASRALTEKEREKLTVFLHRGTTGEWDFDTLANEFEVDELVEWGFELGELGIDIDEREGGGEPKLTRRDVPDAMFPTDNEWGVPLLDTHYQAKAVDLPVQAWGMGAGARTRKMSGTWCFYTEDYRFEALWADPSPVVNSGCVNIVEPNYTTSEQMPRAVALWTVYRKRWIARWWQSLGVRVFADLNVAVPHYDLNLFGIPQGWRAWATRGYTERMDCTEMEYDIACKHAGTDDILFLVYGGGAQVKELAKRRGWVWVAEQRDAAKGRFADG